MTNRLNITKILLAPARSRKSKKNEINKSIYNEIYLLQQNELCIKKGIKIYLSWHAIRKFILHEIPVEMTLAYLYKVREKKNHQVVGYHLLCNKRRIIKEQRKIAKESKYATNKMNANLNTAHSS